ncbi:MAG: SAM-dependent methyltransferase [Methylotenera sp.]
MASLPISSPESQVLSQQLADLIQQKIENNNGWIDFATFMHMALYTPGLGYYSGGAKKFGLYGDFVTAPEISSLFAKTVALQTAQILASGGDVLELGAGTGKLAADLLLELQQLDQLPKQYFILEVSAYLRQVQREILQEKLSAGLLKRVVWLESLPKNFNGLILGNEVLDAIPVHLIHHTSQGLQERGVGHDGEFIWQDKPLKAGQLHDEVKVYSLPNDYLTEACPAASALVSSLTECLESGAILLIDYGFSAREYYHPQRNQGTLMCHYQQLAHDNPLINIGLQDITAHVNFSNIAMLCESHGIRLAGYANQAQFLINCGILDILAQHSPDSPQFMQLAAAAQKYLSPAEMGELFKVIAFTKNIELDLIGFKSGDKTHTL